MHFIYNLFLTIFGIVFINWIWNRRHFYYMSLKIKGPIGLPLIGVALHFRNKKEILQTMGKFVKEFGNCFFLFLGLQPYLYVTDPEIIEEIFTSDKALQKLDAYDPIKSFLGDALFTSKNEKWMHNRKLINKAFTHKTLVSFFRQFNNQGRIVKNQIIKKYVGKGECNILDEVSTCTLYTTMITTMGNDELDFESETTLWIVNLVKTAQNIIVDRMFDPIFESYYPFHYLKKKFEKLKKEFWPFINQTISSRFEMLAKKENETTRKTVEAVQQNNDDDNITKRRDILIDQFYKFYKSNDLTWEDIQSEAATIILAAFETTAYTFFNCLLLLAMNPKYQDILYKEIISVCPEDDTEVTYEHIRHMPYIEMVLNETMRVISTVALVGRKLTDDITLKNGLFIAKGTNIAVDLFHLHRNEKIWGPDPLVFNPDNFLKENITRKNPYSFIPFTKGIRNCVGWRYGLFSLQILLVHVIKMYAIKTNWKLEDLQFKTSITTGYHNYPTVEFSYREKI